MDSKKINSSKPAENIENSPPLPEQQKTKFGMLIERLSGAFRRKTNSKEFKESEEYIDAAKKNKAATIIQRAYKKRLASESYRHMICNGNRYKYFAQKDSGKYIHFRKYHEDGAQKIGVTQVLADIQKFSSLCLKEAKDKIGELNSKEKSFVSKLNSCDMKFVHQSGTELVYKDKNQTERFSILSNKKLISKYPAMLENPNTTEHDRRAIANDDFVFFTPYFVSDSTEKKTLRSLSRKYGRHAYIIDESKAEFGYLTLTDQAHTCSGVGIPKWKKFPSIIYSIDVHKSFRFDGKETVQGKNLDIYMYTKQDMKLGIAYSIINRIRSLNGVEEAKVFIDYALDEARTPDEIRDIVRYTHSSLEFHIPRIVIETDL